MGSGLSFLVLRPPDAESLYAYPCAVRCAEPGAAAGATCHVEADSRAARVLCVVALVPCRVHAASCSRLGSWRLARAGARGEPRARPCKSCVQFFLGCVKKYVSAKDETFLTPRCMLQTRSLGRAAS